METGIFIELITGCPRISRDSNGCPDKKLFVWLIIVIGNEIYAIAGFIAVLE